MDTHQVVRWRGWRIGRHDEQPNRVRRGLNPLTRRLILTDSQRAVFYQGLGQGLSAGLNPVQTLGALEGICDGRLDSVLRRCASAVGKGVALPQTLERQGTEIPSTKGSLR